jgi:hypothetical protein
VVLANVSVQPVTPWWQWTLSVAWLAVVAAGAVWALFGRRE